MKYANDQEHYLEQLSALADGELGSAQAAALVQASRQDADMLQTWSSYHAIGDALRAHVRDVPQASASKPLGQVAAQPALPATSPAPIVASHTPKVAQGTPAANDSLFRWKLVAGVAAFAAVGSMVWALVGAPGQNAGSQLAQRDVSAPATVASMAPGAATVSVVAGSAPEAAPVMIRDARLDELLAAHKQFGGASALQQPAGFLRNATFQQAGR